MMTLTIGDEVTLRPIRLSTKQDALMHGYFLRSPQNRTETLKQRVINITMPSKSAEWEAQEADYLRELKAVIVYFVDETGRKANIESINIHEPTSGISVWNHLFVKLYTISTPEHLYLTMPIFIIKSKK